MAEVTITVPADYVEWFRAGVVGEIEFDARAVMESQSELTADIGDRKDIDAADLRNRIEDLENNVGVLEGLCSGPGNDAEIGGDAEAVAHIAESMARKAIGPQLADELEIGPINDERAAHLRVLVEGLEWAIELAGRCHRQHLSDREEVAA